MFRSAVCRNQMVFRRKTTEMAEVESIEEALVMASANNSRSWLNPWYWLKWRPTSVQLLADAERKILLQLNGKVVSRFVSVHEGQHYLRTISLNEESTERIPVVMVHGMGSGVGLWSLNLDHLAKKRTVHAFDVLGFGRSSRPSFSRDATKAEEQFMSSMEDWRQKMNLDRFILLGHSFGGYLASAYALRHPQHVSHLVLVDPWGFPEKTPNRSSPAPTWIKVVGTMLHPFNPFAGLRLAGPWGPNLIQRLRPDLGMKYSDLNENDEVFNYIYHCNAQDPSGESAFKTMSVPLAWAKYPMCNRISNMHRDVPITMIYGGRSWMDRGVAYQVKHQRNESYVDVQVIKGAGHHVYADRPEIFHAIMDKVFDKTDREMCRTASMAGTSGVSGDLEDDGYEQSSDELQPVQSSV